MTVSTPKETKTLGMGIIECIMAFFKLMNTIFTNSLNISVGICLILALQSALSQAAATPSPLLNENSQLTLTSMLASQQSGSSFILYPISALETSQFKADGETEILPHSTHGKPTNCTAIKCQFKTAEGENHFSQSVQVKRLTSNCHIRAVEKWTIFCIQHMQNGPLSNVILKRMERKKPSHILHMEI